MYHRSLAEENELVDLETATSHKTHSSVLTANLDIALNEDENAVANVYQLLLTLTRIFYLIQESVPRMPRSFSPLFAFVKSEVDKQFGNAASFKAIGSFLFLRFICPALGSFLSHFHTLFHQKCMFLVSPQLFGLLKDPPGKQMQKNLLSLSRIMQNLANETRPGVKSPELQKVDQFIDDNVQNLHQFYENIIVRLFLLSYFLNH